MDNQLIKTAMHDACIRAVTEISADVKGLVQAALDRETNDTAKSMLSSMLENLDIAKAQDKAVCQSPGYPTTWISYGDGNFPSFAHDVICEALGEATTKGYLRPSIVDPLTRHNPGNNTGEGVPNIEYQYHPGQEYVDFIISFKGCGAELGNAMKIFTTANLKLNQDFGIKALCSGDRHQRGRQALSALRYRHRHRRSDGRRFQTEPRGHQHPQVGRHQPRSLTGPPGG